MARRKQISPLKRHFLRDCLVLIGLSFLVSATASGLRVRTMGSGVVQSQLPQPGDVLPQNATIVLHLAEGVR